MSELSQEKLIEEELAKVRENLSAAVGDLVSARKELDAVKADEVSLAAQQKALGERRKVAERTYTRARAAAKTAGVTSNTMSQFPAIPTKPASSAKPAKPAKPAGVGAQAPASALAGNAESARAPEPSEPVEETTAQQAIAS